MRTHRVFLLAFLPLYTLFLWPLFTRDHGFVLADYSVQCYPWAMNYARALQNGHLPLWTPLIGCGFPLFAEGQTGMLYPLNLLLFRALPFMTAYNLMFLLHFLIAGVSTYALGLKLRMSHAAAAFAAVVFTFGAAYGGIAHSFIAMRSLVWFPLCLWLIEDHLKRPRRSTVFIYAFIQTQSWLSGAPQTALYNALFTMVYLFLRLRGEGKSRRRSVASVFLGGLALSIVTALPQLWATAELAARSTRSLQEPAFALWGSVAPWSMLTVFIGAWSVYLRANLYSGVWPLLFIAGARNDERSKLFWALAGASLFFALGLFNPLSWLVIKLPMASFLRNPSKFLFFAQFSLAMLAGLGFDAFLAHRFAARRARLAAAAFLVVAASACAVMSWGRPLLAAFGRWYTGHFVIGKSFHRGSAESYLARIDSTLDALAGQVNILNPYLWLPFALAALFFLCHKRWAAGKPGGGSMQLVAFAVLTLDLALMAFGGYGEGLLGNIGRSPEPAVYAKYPKDGRWLDVNRDAKALFPPNRNMISGHAQVGLYTPLASRDYYLATKDLGAIDDSLGRSEADPGAFKTKRSLLNFMGVKYLATDISAPLKDFIYLRDENTRRFYANADAAGEFALSPSSAGKLSVLYESDEAVTIEVMARTPCVLTRNVCYDPGWTVSDKDGQVLPLDKYNGAFQSVRLDKGTHRLRFTYRPDAVEKGMPFYWGGFAVMLGAIVLGAFRREL